MVAAMESGASARPYLLAIVGASPASRRTVDHLVAIAVATGAGVRLLVNGPRPGSKLAPGWTAEGVAAYAEQRMRRAGIEVERLADAQLARAALTPLAEAAELVVVAREGSNDRLPERLLTALTAPLLVVQDGLGEPGSAYRLLVAVRDGLDVAPLVEAVRRLAAAVPVTALVAHAVVLRADRFGALLMMEQEDPVGRTLAELERIGVPAEGRHLAGTDPAAEMLAWTAEDWGATMVVVNSRRQGGFFGRFLPSTARDMIRGSSLAVLMPPLNSRARPAGR